MTATADPYPPALFPARREDPPAAERQDTPDEPAEPGKPAGAVGAADPDDPGGESGGAPPLSAPTGRNDPTHQAPTDDQWSHKPDESYAKQVTSPRVIGDGNVVAGTNAGQLAGRDIYYNVGAPLSVRVVNDYVRYTADDLDRWSTAFVPPESQDELAEKLRPGGVVVVVGEPGTGRTLSVLAAIRGRFAAAGRISGRIVPANIDVERLDPGCGYLLDATYASWAHTVDVAGISCLAEKLTDTDCAVAVLIGPGTLREPKATPYTVRYHPPESWAVVRAHLRAASPELSGEELAAIRERFDSAQLPNRPRVLAQAADGYIRRHEFRLDEGNLEEAARGCLVKPSEMSHADWAGCRSFLIAWAILDGLPAAKICHASLEIADEIQRVERPGRLRERPGEASADAPKPEDMVARRDGERPGLARTPLDERFDRWYSYVAEVDGTGPPTAAPLLRLLTFATPEFAPTLLRVLWRDHPVIRTPLLRWMHDHVDGEPLEVRQGVARALGVFTAQDFAFIKLHRLNVWAADPKPAMHAVVAEAMGEAARLDTEVREEAAAVVKEWAGKVLPLASTAARALGTEIGRADPEWALRMLRRVATGKHTTKLDHVVALSAKNLFLSGVRGPVVDALIEWNRSGDSHLRGIAARATKEIAESDDPANPGLPPMLAFCRDDPEGAVAVATLWHAVLAGRHKDGDHWRALRKWSRMTPRPPCVNELIGRLAESDVLRPRLRFKLGPALQEALDDSSVWLHPPVHRGHANRDPAQTADGQAAG